MHQLSFHYSKLFRHLLILLDQLGCIAAVTIKPIPLEKSTDNDSDY
uniref:Uncharacterized protein n=1 Tax=Methylophaga nitratireducenticrescens TaxID=754476 RepID=I1XF25_METNJ